MSNPKHKETFTTLIADIASEQASPENVVHDYIAVKREAAGNKLASALASLQHSEIVSPLIDDYTAWDSADSIGTEDGDTIFRGEDVASMVAENYQEGHLIEVWPKSLNERLDGGCLPGHHIVVFARPEMGKTMFLVNAIAGFLAQDLTVLYVGNEDPVPDVALRVISRLSGMTKYEVFDHPEHADAAAREAGYDNLILASMCPGTPREIERLILEYKPQVLLIDQLRNINVAEDHFVQKLEKAATAARNIGKKHDVLVISVTQAGDSASNRAVLEMGDVDSSNTGVPAQADVMIGIGGTYEDVASGKRILSLPKNKRSGKHDFFPVRVDPHTSTIGGIV